jgi:hypothetical protein
VVAPQQLLQVDRLIFVGQGGVFLTHRLGEVREQLWGVDAEEIRVEERLRETEEGLGRQGV